MGKYSVAAVCITVLWAICFISWLILHLMSNIGCKNISYADYNQMLSQYSNYRFAEPAARNSARAIVRYKLQSASDESIKNLNVDDLSDHSLMILITTTIAQTNPSFIDVINDDEYVDVIKDYSREQMQFLSLRAKAISIISKKYIPNLNTETTDAAIYDILINATKPTGS